MGSNMSTVNQRKAPIITSGEIAVSAAPPHAYNRSEAHRWTNIPPVKGDVAVTNPELSRNYKWLSDDQANVIEIIRPCAFHDHSANINKVISFHSSRCWKDYFQASKKSDKLLVIFFSASWSGFCRYMDPILDDFAAQYIDVEFQKIDMDELFVRSISTIIIASKRKLLTKTKY
ncbi:hypothetical protein RND81_11G029000 [Saponaria officinalis]|uniref:Thioredoxin domain-containing protein n=1 Tax=Saponaria officinalis TaxID=3572 RepID=A0AAW1HGB3_SAPOF